MIFVFLEEKSHIMSKKIYGILSHFYHVWQEEHVGTPCIEDLAGILVQRQDGVLSNWLLHVTIINIVAVIEKSDVLTNVSQLVHSILLSIGRIG